MMIADHSAPGNKLKMLASELKLQAPSGLDEKHRDRRDKLAQQFGADFDREYTSAMVDGHKNLIDSSSRASGPGAGIAAAFGFLLSRAMIRD